MSVRMTAVTLVGMLVVATIIALTLLVHFAR
jgi:competence protein ComGC